MLLEEFVAVYTPMELERQDTREDKRRRGRENSPMKKKEFH